MQINDYVQITFKTRLALTVANAEKVATFACAADVGTRAQPEFV